MDFEEFRDHLADWMIAFNTLKSRILANPFMSDETNAVINTALRKSVHGVVV
ncbi:hypothetical protein [Niabella ginsenosidivorans]|uniref:hypothetical protein n=1 Tax=Niabella ginsenosidivorans TaxID=1176587 RepID=UPI0012ED762C|nr:hypothetical protein [Niabella ginsenosidivorans]